MTATGLVADEAKGAVLMATGAPVASKTIGGSDVEAGETIWDDVSAGA
jgi:hypothetical protein